ncbi:MAG TPA: nuclear transport factor 2 family protein, partial [Polyangia bacterium]
MADLLKQGTWKLQSFKIDPDVKVRMIGDDVAVLAYTVHEELTVDGNPVKLQASDASTWVRRDGQWVCALHTEALVGDPFGRDRRETV